MPSVVSVPIMEFLEDEVQERVAKKEWMKDRTFKRAENIEEVMLYVDEAIQAGRCALDLETTGLSSRVRYINGDRVLVNKIVGVCLCFDPKFGLYIPLNHVEADGQNDQPSQYNLPEEPVLSEVQRLCSNCITIYHNAKFDLAHLKNYGITIDSHKKFEDTLFLAYLFDSGQKDKKLKSLSPRFLDQPMIGYEEIAGSSSGRLDLVCPTIASIYGASDAVCTLDLYNFFIEQDIVKSQMVIYNLEKRTMFVVMEMEGNLVKIDKEYLEGLKVKAEKRLKEIENDIYDLAEHRFNIGSPQQIGKVLFDELGYKYPLKNKTASGQYITDSATLERISDVYPVVKKIVELRALGKLLGTYINNLLLNCDEDNCVKLNFKQTGTDTGRFSSPGGKGLVVDGFSGVNVQAIPKEPTEENPDLDLRRAFIARDGKTMVAIDYENEEMRIATNLSNETTWISAIQAGVDFHTATGGIIAGKDPKDVSKPERKIGKVVNFLALYLGGPLTLSRQAKVPLPEAKKILAAFFAGLPCLKKWIDTEIIRARKTKIVKTIFGRTRLLSRFYGSGDRALESHGDRCSINTQVQGCLISSERCLTTRGYLPIIEIKRLKESGKNLKTWTGVSWEEFDVLDRGEAQLAEIELKNGMKLNCDVRHEVLTVGEDGYVFKKFGELTEDTKICVSLPKLLKFGAYPKRYCYEGDAHNSQKLLIETEKEWEFISYFLGCVIGDGGLCIRENTKNHCIDLCFGKEKVEKLYPFIKEKLNKLEINISEPEINKSSKGLSYKIRVYSISIAKLFQRMGYKFHNALDKRVPQQIMESPVEMRKAFLRGYFDTDGCKKEKNKYSFHTPNKKLLQDLQLLAWTLGCPSNIYECCDGSFILNWLDYRRFSKLFNLPLSVKKRYNEPLMSLPDFLREPVLKSLSKCYVKDSNDTAYVWKIREGESVDILGVFALLEDYNCEIPEMYYFSELKEKVVLNKKDTTYTLSVHSPLHRFDSAGIISKNTAADIMKAVMSRLRSWIIRNNLQDDVKMLITMHDELVFEIPTEKIEVLVPEIAKIMMLKEVITDQLKWTIPLTVDIKYGDSWRVKNVFFKDFPKIKETLNEPLREFVPVKKKVVPVPEKETAATAAESLKQGSAEPQDTGQQSQDVPVGEEKNASNQEEVSAKTLPVKQKPQDEEIDGRVKLNEPFIYELRDRRDVTLRWLNCILSYLLEEASQISEEKRQILKIKDYEGNSLLVDNFRVNIKSFLILAKFHGI